VTAPEQLSIETPEQIALEFPLAGVGSRFLAIALDSLVQAAAFVVLGLIGLGTFTMLGRRSLGSWVLAVLVLAGFVVYYGYYAVFEALWRGQTPGKRAVGLRVIAVSGRPVTIYQSVLRNLVRIVDQLPGLYGVGIVSVLVTSRHQRLGDLAAATVVVHERPFEVGFDAPGLTSRGERIGADRIAPQEIAAIELYLQRRAGLDWPARDRMSGELADRVRRRLSLAPGGSDEDLLERTVAEFRSGGGRLPTSEIGRRKSEVEGGGRK
jgi:uncharacterized RDD family membrane protein YckC